MESYPGLSFVSSVVSMVRGLRTTRKAGDEVFTVSAGRDTEDFEDILMIINLGIQWNAPVYV